jgi:hypothetical protein
MIQNKCMHEFFSTYSSQVDDAGVARFFRWEKTGGKTMAARTNGTTMARLWKTSPLVL